MQCPAFALWLRFDAEYDVFLIFNQQFSDIAEGIFFLCRRIVSRPGGAMMCVS